MGESYSIQAWRKAYFIPTWFKWNGTVCAGAELARPAWREGVRGGGGGDGGTVDEGIALFREGVRLPASVRALAEPPEAFAWHGRWFGQPGPVLIDRYAGTPRLREMLDRGSSPDEVADAFVAEAA